ncbi:MAG: flavodoxin-dependent (E)-4-hydroxy-3-methylbut-2-enyl-diphosphate synthase [Thermotogae bacterium]|nr:flavodoxin-dependent (E)-4-hydroxy-3-methylbut-2-enyl-diphosphate synthase [Thermotogota bacterium]
MRERRKVKVGRLYIGGDERIAVQTMTKTDSHDFEATVKQVLELERYSADIIRVSIPDEESVEVIRRIKKRTDVPIVADVHYDYRIAIESVKAGVDKVRINPGNIGESWKVKEIARVAKDHGVPIRVGANSGSLKRKMVEKYGYSSLALVESALEEVRILESVGFEDIVVAVKSSDVKMMIEANEIIACMVDYPIHVGLTEAGPGILGMVKSSIGIGRLLMEGIGDTIRVSLSDDPKQEIITGRMILRSLGLDEGVEIISCPTCSRSELDVRKLAHFIFEKTIHLKRKLRISIMGCMVNGIGEARKTDIGVVGVKDGFLLYKQGECVGKFDKKRIAGILLETIDDVVRSP